MNLTGVPMDDEDYAFLGRLSSLKVLLIQPPSPLEGKSLRHLRNLPELSSSLAEQPRELFGPGHLAPLDGLPKLKDLSVYGDLPDATLKALAGPAGLRSLDVRTNAPIRKETVTRSGRKAPFSSSTSTSCEPVSPCDPAQADAGKSTRTDPARTNRQAPTTTRPHKAVICEGDEE